MAQPKKTTKNKSAAVKARVRKGKHYKSFRLSKRIKNSAQPLPNSFRLFIKALITLKKYRRFFLGIVLVYGILSIILVRGFGSAFDLNELKAGVEDIFVGKLASVTTAGALLAYIITSAGGTATEVTGVYQSVLVIVVSLAIIWGLRQLQAGIKISVKETFYKGMYPLVPFLFVMGVIGLQLTPIIIGSTLYGIVNNAGLAVTAVEKVIWAIFYGLFGLLTLYMLSSSIFALYIVTLPDMTPLVALRSARQLVQHRRWSVMRKVFLLPLFLLLLAAIIFIPLIIFATPVVEWAFFAFTMAGLALVHSYMYNLYRMLL